MDWGHTVTNQDIVDQYHDEDPGGMPERRGKNRNGVTTASHSAQCHQPWMKGVELCSFGESRYEKSAPAGAGSAKVSTSF